MADRKQTPDVLSQVLGGGPQDTAEARAPEAKAQPHAPAPSQPPPRTRADTSQAASGQRSARRRSSSRRKPKPQRWEYLEVQFRDYAGLRPRFVNGEEQEDWKKLPMMQEYLNQLGEEGWELAGVGSRHKDQVPFYLKRRKG